jgi:hypothetical protein
MNAADRSVARPADVLHQVRDDRSRRAAELAGAARTGKPHREAVAGQVSRPPKKPASEPTAAGSTDLVPRLPLLVRLPDEPSARSCGLAQREPAWILDRSSWRRSSEAFRRPITASIHPIVPLAAGCHSGDSTMSTSTIPIVFTNVSESRVASLAPARGSLTHLEKPL